MPQLAGHLRIGATRPFAWGDCDCCLWVCDWIASVRGVDPMASWRGRYSTKRGAYRRIRRGGGFQPTVRAEMAAVGLLETTEPKAGDIGMVQTYQGEALAIRTATGWACKSPRGLVVGQFSVLTAWAV